jgi:hypothetical protein
MFSQQFVVSSFATIIQDLNSFVMDSFAVQMVAQSVSSLIQSLKNRLISKIMIIILYLL